MFLCLILLARFAWIKNLGRCTQTSLPPHNSSLIAHDSQPKNLFLLFFCRKIHKTVHKNAKNSPKNRLVHSRTIAPPPIKYLIICYLNLYTFVHCFSLSFLTLILILQRKSLRTNKNFYPMTKKTFLLTCLLGMFASGIHAYQGATKRVLHSK